MSSFNTPIASQPNHPPHSQPNQLPQFPPKKVPCVHKFRSLADLYQATKQVNIPVDSRPHLPNISGPPVHPKEKYIEDLLKATKVVVAPHIYYNELTCKICGFGDKEDQILICDDCDNGFHMKCLRPAVLEIPPENWYCDGCRSKHPEESTRDGSSKSRKRYFGIIAKYISPEGPQKRRKRLPKKSTKFLPYIRANDVESRNRQMDSLRFALQSKNVAFSDRLTYSHDMAPKSANQSKYEADDIQELSTEDYITIKKCKAMMKEGKCPPLKVVFDEVEGYKVEADGPIKAMTFLAEYTGDVDFVRNRRDDQNFDSFMTLLTYRDSEEEDGLFICPDKRGNIAGFISGINNHSAEGRKKKNLKSVRYNVRGKCHVYLIALRNIKKGERLCYDYNGQDNGYDTQYFI
ncbi:putative Histone-lysine N-methyltransferase ATXR5 [Apium graveolens]|uniref:putative Histone-lysine N-methyltransferase ATXR5 n=1 Tax=Apium graveolens TaxID=4045 RepID=UPI003D79E374